MGKVQRFEYEDGKSAKFWEISVDGNTHTVRYGRIGSDGQSRAKEFATKSDAEASCEKLIQAKVGKGYKKAATKKKQARRKSRLGPELQAAFEDQIEKYELTEYRSELLR